MKWFWWVLAGISAFNALMLALSGDLGWSLFNGCVTILNAHWALKEHYYG